MRRSRLVAAGIGIGLAATALVRRLHGSERGVGAPGGVLMADTGSYDAMSRFLLGSFHAGIAADVAATSPVGARILEVGCGPGHLSKRLAHDHGLDVTGLDLDPAMIERARRSAAASAPAAAVPAALGTPGPSFVVGDAAALPFPDATFDRVVSTLSIHHWSDPTAGITEIARVLKPDGKALLWDLRPGVVPLHRHLADPADAVRAASVRVTSVTPWPWPWRLRLTQRIEVEPAGDLPS